MDNTKKEKISGQTLFTLVNALEATKIPKGSWPRHMIEMVDVSGVISEDMANDISNADDFLSQSERVPAHEKLSAIEGLARLQRSADEQQKTVREFLTVENLPSFTFEDVEKDSREEFAVLQLFGAFLDKTTMAVEESKPLHAWALSMESGKPVQTAETTKSLLEEYFKKYPASNDPRRAIKLVMKTLGFQLSAEEAARYQSMTDEQLEVEFQRDEGARNTFIDLYEFLEERGVVTRFVSVYAHFLLGVVDSKESETLISYTRMFSKDATLRQRVDAARVFYRIKVALKGRTDVKQFLSDEWKYDEKIEKYNSQHDSDTVEERKTMMKAQELCLQAADHAYSIANRQGFDFCLGILDGDQLPASPVWKQRAPQQLKTFVSNLKSKNPAIPVPTDDEIQSIVAAIEAKLASNSAATNPPPATRATVQFDPQPKQGSTTAASVSGGVQESRGPVNPVITKIVNFGSTPAASPVSSSAPAASNWQEFRDNYIAAHPAKTSSAQDFEIAQKRANAYWKKHPRAKARDMAHLSKRIGKVASRFNPSRADWPGVDTP